MVFFLCFLELVWCFTGFMVLSRLFACLGHFLYAPLLPSHEALDYIQATVLLKSKKRQVTGIISFAVHILVDDAHQPLIG